VNWQVPPLSRAPAPDSLAAAYATLWLRPGAPAPVVKAAYRALAALHHPDTGGDVDAMRHLNAAYAVLQATTS
jgi:DnaJ-class molecular chaperone